ncbi:MAG: hypothetical protein M1825_003014 [Sarcosagium campestre]|nr:MAG: hypothetical protein M1825_003014 [Sarcosagium campestre]
MNPLLSRQCPVWQWLPTALRPAGPLSTQPCRNTRQSSNVTSSAKFRILPTLILPSDDIDTFRQDCFIPELPALLPKAAFGTKLPATTKWFQKSSCTNAVELNTQYLSPFRGIQVPLELTRFTKESNEVEFEQLQAPLGLFLDACSVTPTKARQLYLAQAPLSDLPRPLRDDLPTPELVTEAGRGDVYDENIWIGRAPTYTPLHKDPNPNLFVQLCGTKQVRVFAPQIGSAIFRDVQQVLGRQQQSSTAMRGAEMMMGAERRMLEEVVWQVGCDADGNENKCYEAVLQAGDGLFIPKYWWHSIKGVGEGITGSREFANF